MPQGHRWENEYASEFIKLYAIKNPATLFSAFVISAFNNR